jgi:hypothetical protein
MKYLIDAARFYLAFIGASGFLFGQLFFGDFSIVATMAGVSGILAGALSWPGFKVSRYPWLVTLCCSTGLVGVALDVYHYYSEDHVPGNSYAWFLIGPFIVCLLLVGYESFSRRVSFKKV